VSRSSWWVWPKVNARRNVPTVDGARTRWPSTVAVDPQHVDLVDAVPPARIPCPGSAAWRRVGRTWPLAEVDELVGGLLDPQPLGQGGGQQQPRSGDRVGVVEGDVELVQGVGGWHRESALLSGITAALAGAILPAQRAFLIIGSVPFHYYTVHPGSFEPTVKRVVSGRR
jgi:hypothetical protein